MFVTLWAERIIVWANMRFSTPPPGTKVTFATARERIDRPLNRPMSLIIAVQSPQIKRKSLNGQS
jgi:hypothetical protein